MQRGRRPGRRAHGRLRQVEGTLNLERSQTGPPDAGTRGGHGADRYLLRARDATATVTGTVRPASAAIELVDEAGARVARANVAPDGRFVAALPELLAPRERDVPPDGQVRERPAVEDRDRGVGRAGGGAASAGRPGAGTRPHAARRDPPAAQRWTRGELHGARARRPGPADPAGRAVGSSHRLIRPRRRHRPEHRASLTYRRICPDSAGGRRVVLSGAPFPSSRVARVQRPGALAPAERRRRARLRLAPARLRPARQGVGGRDQRVRARELQRSDRFELGRV